MTENQITVAESEDGFDSKSKQNGNNSLEVQPFEDQLETGSRKPNFMKIIITNLIIHIVIAGYFAYVTFYYITSRDTCVEDCDLYLCSSYGMLLFVLGLVYFGLLYYKFIKPYLGNFINQNILEPGGRGIQKIFSSLFSRIILVASIFVVIFGFMVFESWNDLGRLRALGGIALFVGIVYLLSANRRKMKWRPIICGAVLQFVFGILFIQLPAGRSIFECFGLKFAQFLSFGREGAVFAYGEFLILDKMVFAFSALSIIYFFSSCISVLYYLGAVQWFLFKLGWFLQSILGTTVCESVVAAGNIFLGLAESPLVIRPYIKSLTHSEIHAVMTSGMATVSGSVFAAYISFGAQPQHLITASVMAAPASLFFSKLMYPETEESNTSAGNIQLEKSTHTSILEAASVGASQAIDLILNIIANIIAFVSFVAFANALIQWITYLVGFESVGFEFLLGKFFMPVSWIIGIPWEDCDEVGHVIGLKTVVNEFVAFHALGQYIQNGEISPRSAAIATFAICSFANPGSIGITIGGLSALAPERKSAITKLVLRAFIAANFVTLVTASIAGLLMPEDMY